VAVVTVLSLWFAALVAYASWMFLRRKSLTSIAVAVDEKATLNGELTTAYWFYRKGLSSAWIDLQRGRAARTAEMLDPTQLFPYSAPRSSWLTVALLALCFIFALFMQIVMLGTMVGNKGAFFCKLSELIPSHHITRLFINEFWVYKNSVWIAKFLKNRRSLFVVIVISIIKSNRERFIV